MRMPLIAVFDASRIALVVLLIVVASAMINAPATMIDSASIQKSPFKNPVRPEPESKPQQRFIETALRLRFEDQPVLAAGVAKIAVNYTLTNSLLDRKVSFGVRTSPLAFAELCLTKSGKLLPIKSSAVIYFYRGNIVSLLPEENCSAVVQIDEIFDLTESGTYKLQLKKTIDILTFEDFNEQSVPLFSNELTFVIPGP